MKSIIAASTSTMYGGNFLEYLHSPLKEHFKGKDTLLFIPYARPGGISYDDYAERVRESFRKIGMKVEGIHDSPNPQEAVQNAQAIYIGGGNTFVLLDELIKEGLLPVIREAVENGTPYLGSSAGSNVVGPTVKTTNDMPIVYPNSFKSLGLVPFNINPHYLDPDPTSKHKGETRETRIKEFHTQNTEIVVGLREGSWIEVKNHRVTLKGELSARIFKKDEIPFEVNPEADLSRL